MEGCTKFMNDDPSLETVRTDLAELLNILERYIICDFFDILNYIYIYPVLFPILLSSFGNV